MDGLFAWQTNLIGVVPRNNRSDYLIPTVTKPPFLMPEQPETLAISEQLSQKLSTCERIAN